MACIKVWESDMVVGAHGIPEPGSHCTRLSPPDVTGSGTLWLVPGVAFDRAGRRLGRGGGHYDRLLAGGRGPRVGVAYDWQIVPVVPCEPHDVRMHWVVTDARVYGPGRDPGPRGDHRPCECGASAHTGDGCQDLIDPEHKRE